MKLETVRIDLGSGDHALVYKDVLRVTARLHEAELRKYMTPVEAIGDGGKVLLSQLEKLETMPKTDFMIDMSNIDNDAINGIFILNQTVEWSLGPVDNETLDRCMTREQYKAMVQEMDRLYKPVPLAGSAS